MLRILLLFIGISINAQIPYFGSTQGKDKKYVYSSYRFQEKTMYNTFQYGVTDRFDVGMDMYVNHSTNYPGITVRYYVVKTNHFDLGVMNFTNFEDYKFSFNVVGLMMNGNYKGFSIISNTWYTTPKTLDQWTYIGYKIGNFNPYIGHANEKLAYGFWYKVGMSNLYVWNNKDNFTVGIDFYF